MALLWDGTRKLLAQAVAAKPATFLVAYADLKDERGRRAVGRNGHLSERQVMMGSGEMSMQVPKTRDRSGCALHVRSSLIPPYLKRAQRVEMVLSVLYLKGISSGEFQEALGALLSEDAAELLATTMSRLSATWQKAYKARSQGG
jgi:transposase-like protein